jgi:BirA family biotin operon repressor/biotin-[acetyl-CoA-carboxylase] ligase
VREELGALLPGRGVPAGGSVEHHAALPSTSDRVRELARLGAREWSVVIADEQWAGRGRSGHSWVSPPGNLFASVLLRPRFPAATASLVPLAAGLAVAEALEAWTAGALLKWPNDVLMGGRKLAGVLVESTSAGAAIDSMVVGFGINVGLDPTALPEPLNATATSILAETGRPADCLEVAAAVLGRLAVWYHALHDGHASALIEAWRTRSVPWWGRDVEIQSGGTLLRGQAQGIDETGALLLKTFDGVLLHILSGEAREVRVLAP